MLMTYGFTPAEIDAMPVRDVDAFIEALPVVQELTAAMHVQ